MEVLTKKQILEVDDLPRIPVEIPEWGDGVGVYIRKLTSAEHTRLVKEGTDDGGKLAKGFREMIAVFCVVNEAGLPVFLKSDMAALGLKAMSALDRIANAAMEYNGLTDASRDDLAKNSATPTPDSSSG